jgi:hypothetical protein
VNSGNKNRIRKVEKEDRPQDIYAPIFDDALAFDASDVPADRLAKFAYCAFGSNLHRAQMAFRCPDAEPLDRATLPGFRLVFRRVADVTFDPGHEVPVGLWSVTRKCVRSLDRYEGFPNKYGRRFVQVFTDTGPIWAFAYSMRDTRIAPPTKEYFNTILAGYRDFDLPTETLISAAEHAITSRSHAADACFPSTRKRT